MLESMKKVFKDALKSLAISIAYLFGGVLIVVMTDVIFEFSSKFFDLIIDFLSISFMLLFVVLFFVFTFKKKKEPLKQEKIKDLNDYVIVDVIKSGNIVLAIYFYNYKDGKFDDSFFFSFYGKYKLENASIFLSKIKNLVEDMTLISDEKENYDYLDRLFTYNNVECLNNERLALNEYIEFNNIRKYVLNNNIDFVSIDDVFVRIARNVNSAMTKQIFEGRLMYILALYHHLKEAK